MGRRMNAAKSQRVFTSQVSTQATPRGFWVAIMKQYGVKAIHWKMAIISVLICEFSERVSLRRS